MANFKVNDVPSYIRYTATASQTQFSIPFPFINNSDLSVWQNGILLVLTTDYTLSGAQTSSGGLLTLNSGASLNDIITIQDLMIVDRTNIYIPTISNLTGSALNNDFNRDVIMIRDLETTVNYLMLQYAPYDLISQDIDVTTDRIIPLLPASTVWRKDPTNMFIQAIVLPDNPVGTMGVFTANNRLVSTDLPSGNTYIKQTDLQLSADTLTAISGNLNLVGSNDVSINTPGDITLIPGANLYLDGSRWPLSGAAPFKVLGFPSGTSTNLSWVYVAMLQGAAINNAIVTFYGTTGAIQSSNLEIVGNEISSFSGDVTIGAQTNNILVTNDPTQPLGIATKEYVDNSFAGAITGGNNNGSGLDVFDTVSGQTMEFNTITATGSSTATLTGNTITINSTGTAFDYLQALWVSQANGDNLASGVTIDAPLLLVNYAVGLASTTPTLIYAVDANISNGEAITTTGAGQLLYIDAPGTIFAGTITIASGDTVYLNCVTCGNIVNSGTLYLNSQLPSTITSNTGNIYGNSGGVLFGGLGVAASTDSAAAYNFPTTDGTSGQVPTTDGAGNVTWQTGGITWVTIGGVSQAAAPNTGYVVGNAALTSITMPPAMAVGDEIAIEGLGVGGWSAICNTGQVMIFTGGAGTTSYGGSLSSTSAYDNAYFVCIVANTVWKLQHTNSHGLIVA